MKPITLALVTVAAITGVGASTVPAYGQAAQESVPVFVTDIPPGYRDWGLISLSHLTAGKLGQLRSQLGNDITLKAYREGTLPFPDGAIVAALHWNDAVSQENNNALAALSIGGVAPQSTVAGSFVNIQFMVKDSKKYAATGGWGFGDFTDGKPANQATMKACFGCHQLARDHDFVFARYAVSH